jgi:GTP-binding protein EngB required for normal cell division
MTALLEGAKRRLGLVRSDIGARAEALDRAVRASRGRVDDQLLDEAATVVRRVTDRMALSGHHTVVALAGATGSGKSSTFNALAGMDLAAVGVRRPTTSATMAFVWGADGAGDLLGWLGVPRRHQVSRTSVLDGRPDRRDGPDGPDGPEGPGGPTEAERLDGLVLLDLPDHDSTEVEHHLEVDRLVALADLLVWVLDPQKYADAAVHERYLRPLSGHRDVVMVVLNQVDRLAPARREEVLADLRRLLDDDGLAGVPVVALSARTGEGVDALRDLVADRVAAKRSAADRLSADVSGVAHRLQQVTGSAGPAELSRQREADLVSALADAAGVSTVVRAVERSTVRRGAQATGWPLTSWLGRLRPDPLRRLHLDLGEAGRELTVRSRTSLPEATPVQRARVDTAVRAVVDEVSAPLERPWAAAVRRASVSRLPELEDALDRAVTGTDLGVSGTPWWWRLLRGLQLTVLAVATAGALWLTVLFALGYLQLPAPEAPDVEGLPVPTLLLVAGVLAGLLLTLLSKPLNHATARSRARQADRRLRSAVAEVTHELVTGPIEAELTAHTEARDAVAAALR